MNERVRVELHKTLINTECVLEFPIRGTHAIPTHSLAEKIPKAYSHFHLNNER